MVVRSPSYISFHFFELFRIQIDDPIVDADCEDGERKKAGELQGDALGAQRAAKVDLLQSENRCPSVTGQIFAPGSYTSATVWVKERSTSSAIFSALSGYTSLVFCRLDDLHGKAGRPNHMQTCRSVKPKSRSS